MKSRCSLRVLTAMALTLTGCATSELSTAPARYDSPWSPSVASDGAVVAAGRQHKKGLALPAGYVLPSDFKALAAGTSSVLPPRTGKPYSLPDLIDVAQSANPDTKKSWEAARNAALAVGIIKSTYLPYLSAAVVGGWSRSRSDKTNASLTGDGYELNADGTPGRRSHGAGEVQTLSMKWLLFDFGRREALVRSARELQLASNVIFTAAHQKVMYGVTIAFYTHAAAASRIKLLRIALENARHIQQAAEARLRHGQGTIVDVTQAQQATAQVELRLVQAEGESENTYVSLLTAAGVSADSHITFEDVSGRPLSLDDVRMSDNMVKAAVARRPDVLAAYAAARAAHHQVTAARDAFLPSIFTTGNIAYSTGNMTLSSVPGAGNDATLNLSGSRFSSLILGGVSIPIFNGGLKAALLKRAHNQEESANATLKQTVNESIKQIVTAENALHTSLSAYNAAGRLYTASQTSFDASFTAYTHGAGSVTQAEMARNGLLDATISRSDAYYAALIAAASLAFSTGSLG